MKKTDYNAKILDTEKKVTHHDHDKYITTSEFNHLPTENFAARLAQANLVTKIDFDAELISLNKKITQIKQKFSLEFIKKIKTFYLSCFRCKNYFVGDDVTQNYLVFQPMYK